MAARSSRFGLHRSRRVVLHLSALFALEAFGGGFVLQSVVAYWFHLRFGVDPAALGAIFLGANLLAGFSALTAAWVARRIGLVNTMVFTHLPSNVLLVLVPLMPTLPLAVACWRPGSSGPPAWRVSRSFWPVGSRSSTTCCMRPGEEAEA